MHAAIQQNRFLATRNNVRCMYLLTSLQRKLAPPFHRILQWPSWWAKGRRREDEKVVKIAIQISYLGYLTYNHAVVIFCPRIFGDGRLARPFAVCTCIQFLMRTRFNQWKTQFTSVSPVLARGRTKPTNIITDRTLCVIDSLSIWLGLELWSSCPSIPTIPLQTKKLSPTLSLSSTQREVRHIFVQIMPIYQNHTWWRV